MARRKKVKEQIDHEVVVTQTQGTGGQPKQTTVPVKATTADQALDMFQKQDPQTARDADEITVRKPQAGSTTRSSAVQPQTAGQPSLTQSFESTKFRYSYTIGLPGGFSDFMKKTKGRTKGLVVEQRDGRVYMTVESPEAMDKLMGKLKKSSRSKVVETRDKASTLIRGIMGSMK